MHFRYIQSQFCFPEDYVKEYKILSLDNTIHIAKDLGDLANYQNKKYESGEYITFLDENLINKSAIITGNISPDNIMEFISMIDAAKRARAIEIILVVPYFSYSRQDKMEAPCSSIGFEIMAKIINSFQPDKLITIDIHNPGLLDLFDFEVQNINMYPNIIMEFWKLNYQISNYQIIVPDEGAYRRINIENAICLGKKRKLDSLEYSLAHSVHGERCIIIDDIVDSGKTLRSAIDFLYQNGASEVLAYATHILNNNNIQELSLTTDSIEGIKCDNKIKLAKIIREYLEESIN